MTTIKDAVSSGLNNIKNYVMTGLTDANKNRIDQINNSPTSSTDSTQRDIFGRPIKPEVNGGRALTEPNPKNTVPKPSSRVTQIANSLSQFTTGNPTNFSTMMPGISNPTSNSDFNSNPQVSKAAPPYAPPMIINNVSAVASANNAGSSGGVIGGSGGVIGGSGGVIGGSVNAINCDRVEGNTNENYSSQERTLNHDRTEY